jgi:hypothetical protein
MTEESKASAPREFLLVAIPDRADVGATLRLLGVARSLVDAEKQVDELDPGTLGRIAVLERKSLFMREPAVRTLAVTDAIAKK